MPTSSQAMVEMDYWIVWNYYGSFTISSVPFSDWDDANYHMEMLRGRKGVSKLTLLETPKENK